MLCEARVPLAGWVWAPIRGWQANEVAANEVAANEVEANEVAANEVAANERDTDAVRVHTALKRIARARAALDAEEVAALREAQRIQLWREFGYASLIEYMERELLYTPRAAVERLRVANIIEQLPEIEAALQQGTLSFSGARELSRVVTPETQRAWLDAAEGKNVREIEELVSGRKRGDTPDDPVDEQAKRRVLRFDVMESTAAIVRHYQKMRTRQLGGLIDDDFVIREVFQLALDKMVEDRRRSGIEGRRQSGDDDPRVLAVEDCRTAGVEDCRTAGVEDCRSAASEVATDAKPRIGTKAVRPRYQHSVVTCDRCKRGWLDAAGARTLLSPAQVECVRCDAEDIGFADAAGPVRKRSKIPPRTRRNVLARDGHRCRVPGCRSTNIDLHHLHPVELGGSHHESNLLTLCEGHHLAVHDGKLVIIGRAPDVRFEFTKIAASATSFDIEARAVETQRALEQLGFERQEAIAAARAARTHVGMNDQPIEVWLKAALDHCRELVK
jgi:hypothetical protein